MEQPGLSLGAIQASAKRNPKTIMIAVIVVLVLILAFMLVAWWNGWFARSENFSNFRTGGNNGLAIQHGMRMDQPMLDYVPMQYSCTEGVPRGNWRLPCGPCGGKEGMAGCQGGKACGGGGCYGYVSPIGLESQTSEFVQSNYVPACMCAQPPSYPALAEAQALTQAGAFANKPLDYGRFQAMVDSSSDAAAGLNDPALSNLLMNGHCAPNYHTM